MTGDATGPHAAFGGGWNHRVIRFRRQTDPGFFGDYYAIHEVYYDTQRRPSAYTEGAAVILGESLDDLREELARFAKAIEQPVIDERAFDAPSSSVPSTGGEL